MLYAAGEDRAGVARRIIAHHQNSGLSETDIGIWQGISLADTRDIEHLQSLGERYDFVINDTLSRATPGLDENSNSDMAAAIERAYQLSTMWRCFVLMVSHTARTPQRRAWRIRACRQRGHVYSRSHGPARLDQSRLPSRSRSRAVRTLRSISAERDRGRRAEYGRGCGRSYGRCRPRLARQCLCRRVLSAEPDITAKAVFQRVTDQQIDRCNPQCN